MRRHKRCASSSENSRSARPRRRRLRRGAAVVGGGRRETLVPVGSLMGNGGRSRAQQTRLDGGPVFIDGREGGGRPGAPGRCRAIGVCAAYPPPQGKTTHMKDGSCKLMAMATNIAPTP